MSIHLNPTTENAEQQDKLPLRYRLANRALDALEAAQDYIEARREVQALMLSAKLAIFLGLFALGSHLVHGEVSDLIFAAVLLAPIPGAVISIQALLESKYERLFGVSVILMLHLGVLGMFGVDIIKAIN